MSLMRDRVQEILTGSMDFNTQAYPDAENLRMDAMETARSAYESQMAGFVLKSAYYPSTPIAYLLNQMYPGLSIIGSITLNQFVGGLNPKAMMSPSSLNTKVVWIPKSTENTLTKNYSLSNPMKEILKIIAANNLVLALDQLSYSENIIILEEAEKNHIANIVTGFNNDIPNNDNLKHLTDFGAFIEFRFSSCMPPNNPMSIKDIAEKIKFLGYDKCIVSSDFGQWYNPSPAEGIRLAISSLLKEGLDSTQITQLVKSNPLNILK